MPESPAARIAFSRLVAPLLATLLIAALTAPAAAQRIRIIEETELPDRKAKEETPAPLPPRPGMIEAFFNDSGRVWIEVLDEKIQLVTPYGPLEIPFKDIRRVQFAVRYSKQETQQFDALIVQLGDEDFERREEATKQLLAMGDRAYPKLMKVRKHANTEVKRRVNDLLNGIKENRSPQELRALEIDVVYTEDAKITGRLAPGQIKVDTIQFGQVELKIADLREARHPDYVEPAAPKKKKKDRELLLPGLGR